MQLNFIYMVVLLAFTTPAMAQSVNVPKVQVQSFKVEGNSLLSQAQIDVLLDSYKGQRSVEDLKRAAAAIQALYREAGYGAVVAFLPEQALSGNQILITVVEGKIAKVNVDGAQQFSEANIRASLPALIEGNTPRVREIDAQIQLANENPAKQIDVLLQPGDKPGNVDARIKVTEQKAGRFNIGLDNTGNSSTGRLRANFGYQNAALFDRDHVLALQLQVAPEELESVAVVSANYRIPLYAQGMAIDAYAAYSDVDGGTSASPAGPLQFSGRGQIAGLRLAKYLPRIGEIDHRLIVGLDNRDYINNCNIVGLPPGACGNAGESVSVQPLAIEYVVQKGGQNRFSASASLLQNLHFGGRNSDAAQFQKVRPGSNPRYTALRLGLFAALAMPEDWQIQMRLIGQGTGDMLVPGEQFGLGGASSVRGYNERELTGDSGAATAIEVWSPELGKTLGSSGSLRLLAFADAGWVKNHVNNMQRLECRLGDVECRIGSVGVGLRYGSGPLQARMDIAYALAAGNRTARHDSRAHFSVSYGF